MAREDRLAFYVHIPYCVKRCGYCDFNTYTPAELQIQSSLEEISTSYIDLVLKEIELSRSRSSAKIVPSIFFGGGTPSLMQPRDLGRVIEKIASLYDLPDSAEVTLEANPDSVSIESLRELKRVGFNRISFGMQSAVPHVLQVLDRTHNPANVDLAVYRAAEAGFSEISLDLIYGTPGESMEDWQKSLDVVLGLPVTHVSAYALIVEEGTKLANAVKRGDIVMPDDDQTADKYLLADEKFSNAGMDWYELSNWSKPGSECKHNLFYWWGDNWWGVGPGAHSHIDGNRWWNVKHPGTYKERLLAGDPVQSSEILGESEREEERIMLGIRLPEGIAKATLTGEQINRLESYLSDGYLGSVEWSNGRVSLTRTGRLIADRIVRELLI